MLELHIVHLDDMHHSWRIEEAATPFHILILQLKGEALYFIDGETVELSKGDLLYIPAGTVRSGKNSLSGPHKKCSAHFLINEPEKLPFYRGKKSFKIKLNLFNYMQQRFSFLVHQWLTQLPEYLVICEGIVIEMLGHVARDSEMKQFSPAKVRLVKETQNYLLHHFKEKVSISELASQLNRTPNYLTNTYKEITGFTPISYVHHLRIQTAIQLLGSSPITIREVSDLLGYSDQSHFNKMFKKLMGYPPSVVHQ
ncbi:helix-turn-helix domain-containing protein [Paenibacillus nasutitermitis]|uniref:HTH araC/xylS-type domain-containing protein n=1 Tax=Paenibacillus nasutitermitis TaxID=1652958 RepID=A0A917E2W7_9BACL|nr:AraC family transcriptional regulator [Paenibacillus nasutitermitis]GGD94931.1 hypothetical protein GCM10010911_62000 [Paenibacillus nasutitermitis]